MRRRNPLIPDEVISLAPFVEAGVFQAAEVHLAATFARLGALDPADEKDRAVVLALAAAAAGIRHDHTCLAIDDIADLLGRPTVGDEQDDAALQPAHVLWPETSFWARTLSGHRLVSDGVTRSDAPVVPLVFASRQLYLQRAWMDETVVCEKLTARVGADRGEAPELIARVVDEVFERRSGNEQQRNACAMALRSALSVIVGGPGTGKTYTIARIIGAATRLGDLEGNPPVQIALAAPTGKAAARMTAAVAQATDLSGTTGGELPVAVTLDRLLGMGPGRNPRFNASNRLPHDLVIVDETSMVDLAKMAKLLAALGDSCRLVLVGDPFQLASVEVGTVLHDIVAPVVDPASSNPAAETSRSLASMIVRLDTVHRFGAGSGIARLADACRQGDADAALALLVDPVDDRADPELTLLDPNDADALGILEAELAAHACAARVAASGGDAAGALEAIEQVKVLAAHRRGPMSVADWTQRIAASLPEAGDFDTYRRGWFAGRPVLVTVNDPIARVANGDHGVAVTTDDGVRVALRDGAGIRLVPPTRLPDVSTWWAMTIHKSQGSEFDHVVVSLPLRSSPILTRELLYTAITRAKKRVTIVATEEILRDAIGHPIARSSGLQARLHP